MSSFICRRATTSDVSAVRTLVEQQRLAGVRYSDQQQSTPDGSQPSSASAHSTSSLFAARSASNTVHLRAVWGTADIAPLLASQWLTAVVTDGDEVLCVACFHYQPSQHCLGGARLSRDWPTWLPHSLRSVSSSSALLSSFQPAACRFLTYFACCTVANSRSERALVDCLLRFVFECDRSVSQVVALRPHLDRMTPVDNTPLSLLFKALEEPSAAATAATRPSSASASSSAVDDLLTCWRVLRSSLWPTLTVRRGRLEDHDDLLPLFEQHTKPSSASALSSFPSSLTSTSASAAVSAASPLSLLSSTGSVSLVAECGGRAVGLLCLTEDVDMERLSEQFEVDHMRQLGRSQPATSHSEYGWLDDDWSEVSRLPASVVRHLRLCYNALLAAGGTCALSPASRSPSLSLDSTQQQQHPQQPAHILHTAGIDWQTLLQLLAATATEAMQRDSDQQVEVQTATELASTIQGWAAAVDNAEGGSTVPRLASETDFLRLTADCVALLHSKRGDSTLLPSLVGHWLDCLECKMPSAALHHLRGLQQFQQAGVDGEQGAVDRASESSAFAVSCFVLSDEHMQQAEQFILAAFAAVPQRHWMLLSAPYTAPHTTIMARMTQLQPRAHRQHDTAQAVYALHRYTAISALSPLDATIDVRRAEQSDLSALTPLLTAQAAAEYRLPTLSSVAAGGLSCHASRLSASASASNAVRVEMQRVKRSVETGQGCLIVTCAGECVGLVRAQRLQSRQHLLALEAHYQTLLAPAVSGSEQLGADAIHGRHLLIRSFVLHPLFACHTRLVLQETMRLCDALELHCTVTAEQPSQQTADRGESSSGGIRPAGSFDAALLRCMQQRAPLIVPAAPITQQDKYDALYKPAPATTGSSSHNSTALSMVDEAAIGTERLSRAGHEDDTAASPGPSLSLTQLHMNHGGDQQQHSHRPPSNAVSCPACLSLSCPPFALHSVSPPLLSVSRHFVSQRLVFIGAGATTLSALTSLLTAQSAVYFTSLTLISLQPLSSLCGRGCSPLSAPVTAVPSSDFHLERDMLQRVCIDARVQLVTGRVVDVDSARQLITVFVTATQHAVSHTLLVPYDELIMATGTQPVSHNISQQLSVGQPTAAAANHSRVEGSSGTVRLLVEAATPSSGSALSQQPQQTQQQPPAPPHPASVASSMSHSQLASTEWSEVSGVWPMSSLEHAVAFFATSVAQLLPSSSALSTSQASPPSIVISGGSLSALTAICALLSVGVAGDCICWVHPHSNLSHLSGPPSTAGPTTDSSHSLSVAVLGDELPLMAAVLTTLADERIRIVQRASITGMNVRMGATSATNSNHSRDSDVSSDHPMHTSHRQSGGVAAVHPSPSASCSSSRVLQSVVLSSGDVLSCSLLVLCDECAVDGRLLDMAVRRLGLVHDGRFVVDEHFRSASLPNVRLAGPIAKFQRGLLPPATEAARAAGGSNTTGLGVKLLDHAFYSSISVGRALATEIERAATQQQQSLQPSSPLSAEHQPQPQSAVSLFDSLHDVSCVRRAVLPGPVCYFHTWSAAYSLQPSSHYERALTQSFSSYTFSLHVCSDTLRIVRVRYWGAFELPAAHNLTRLIGLPVTYCNRLLWRWESHQIRSLLLFLQQDWAQVLYSPAFSHFRRGLIAQLGQLYGAQLQPIADKLTAFQRTVRLDQQRRHDTQQLQHQRRSSNIKSALLQTTHHSSATTDSVDVSALQALTAFVPASFKDFSHRAVLTFIASQQQSMPACLHQPQPVPLQHVI